MIVDTECNVKESLDLGVLLRLRCLLGHDVVHCFRVQEVDVVKFTLDVILISGQSGNVSVSGISCSHLLVNATSQEVEFVANVGDFVHKTAVVRFSSSLKPCLNGLCEADTGQSCSKCELKHFGLDVKKLVVNSCLKFVFLFDLKI